MILGADWAQEKCVQYLEGRGSNDSDTDDSCRVVVPLQLVHVAADL